MEFRAPTTQEELDEIIRVCKLTRYDAGESAAIGNVWATHVNPRQGHCHACGDAVNRQRQIVMVASSRQQMWQDAIAQQAVDDFKGDDAKTKTKNKNKNTK